MQQKLLKKFFKSLNNKIMKVVRWLTYPECRPQESGLYMVNRKLNNMYLTVLSYFDIVTSQWYDSNDRESNIEWVSAFNPFKVRYVQHAYRQNRQIYSCSNCGFSTAFNHCNDTFFEQKRKKCVRQRTYRTVKSRSSLIGT